jgi:hypothetical protein
MGASASSTRGLLVELTGGGPWTPAVEAHQQNTPKNSAYSTNFNGPWPAAGTRCMQILYLTERKGKAEFYCV